MFVFVHLILCAHSFLAYCLIGVSYYAVLSEYNNRIRAHSELY